MLIVALTDTAVDKSEYQTAAASSKDAFELYMDSIISESPLSGKDKLQAIENHWQ